MEIFTVSSMIALAQVIMVDLLLAVDNTIVVGLAAASLPAEMRKRVIFLGIVFATILRVIFAVATSFLLTVIGLMFAGGLLLLWVAWKMFRETHHAAAAKRQKTFAKPKTFRQAVVQVVFADVAMSLDNVLGVAGAAREHTWVLVFGLALSVVLMGAASAWLAEIMTRHRWLVYVGIGVVFIVALEMIWFGGAEIFF